MKKSFLLMISLSFFIISCNVKEEHNIPKTAEDYYETAIKEYSVQNYLQAKEHFYELITKYPDSDLKNKSEEYIKEILKIDKEQIDEILNDISSKTEKVKTALEKEELLQKAEKQYKYDYLYKDYPDIKDYISKSREQIKDKLSKNILKDISSQVKNCKTAKETKNLLDHIKRIYEDSYLYEENSDVEKYIYRTMEEIQAKLEEERILEELGIEFVDFKTGWKSNSYWSYPMIIMKIKNVGSQPITNLKVTVSFELNNERIDDIWGYFIYSQQPPLQPGYTKTVTIESFDYRVDYMKFTNVIANVYINIRRDEGFDKTLLYEDTFIKTVKIKPIKLVND